MGVFICKRQKRCYHIARIWSHRLAVRTSDSHSENTGSIPVGTANYYLANMTMNYNQNNFNLKLIMVLLVLFGGLAIFALPPRDNNIQKDGDKKPDYASVLRAIDSMIRQNDFRRDSMRANMARYTADILNQNPEYRYICENQPTIDSLTAANDELLGRAYSMARRHSVMTVPRRNATLFTNYKDVRGIPQIGWKYYANRKKIQEFERRKSAIANLPQAVRNHCDSTVLAQIDQLQRQKDSLLNEKMGLINARMK